MTTIATPDVRPANPRFSSGPCSKRPGWTPEALADAAARPLAPRQDRQGQAQAGHRPHPRSAAGAGGPPHRHRAGLRHGRRRDGAVVAARRARRRHARLGELRRGLGDGRRQAAEARRRPHDHGRLRQAPGPFHGRFRPRRGLHLERHDLGRARAERRFHSRRPQGTDDLRRHLGRLRPAARLRQARCRDLLLAEGARRRGRPRRADPRPARRRAAGEPTRRPGRCRRSSA